MAGKKLSILMVADVSIARVIGGAERALHEYSTRLARRGHDVHLLTRRLPWHESDQEKVQGVSEWRFDFNDGSVFSSLYTTKVKSGAAFRALLRSHSFDVINFHQPFTALGVISSSESRCIRKVYTCHSLSFEEFRSRNPIPPSLFGRLLYELNTKLRFALEKYVLDRSDKVVVLSEFTREKLVSHYRMAGAKIRIIPGGVDLERFSPAADKMPLRRKFKIPPDAFVLFTVRNLVARMGLENLITAISMAAAEIPDLFVVIGGRGPLLENLQNQARQLGVDQKILFPGFIAEQDLPDYYRLADMFVLATKELEGFGLVTVEALASGLPVLGTPVGGTREILSRLDKELLFKDAGAPAMAESLRTWMQKFRRDPGLLPRLSLDCRCFAEKIYSWEDKIDQFEEEFRGAAGIADEETDRRT